MNSWTPAWSHVYGKDIAWNKYYVQLFLYKLNAEKGTKTWKIVQVAAIMYGVR